MFVATLLYLIVPSLTMNNVICKTKRKLQIINSPSVNLVTIINKPSFLKKRYVFDLHDSICIPDKIKYLSSPLTTFVNFISVPPKIWHPKPKNKYALIDCTDVDEDLHTFKHYSKAMKHTPSWKPRNRFDIISWSSSNFLQELDYNFVIESMTNDFTYRFVLQIIHDN